MHPTECRDLLGHMQWADALLWDAVLRTPAARADAVMRERLHHVHSVQHAYLQLWRGEPLRLRELGDFDAPEQIRDWALAYYAEAAGFVAGLGGGTLNAELVVPWVEGMRSRWGEIAPATVGQSVLQVALHTMHHRGQAIAHLRQLGGEPPLVDFIVWVWRGAPAAEWGRGEG